MDKFFLQKVLMWTFIACSGALFSRMLVEKYGPIIAGPLFLSTFIFTYVYARIIFVLDQRKEVEKFLQEVKEVENKEE